MKPRPGRYSIPLLESALILAVWILHKHYIHAPAIDARLEHVATQLDGFTAQNQLAIELLPLGYFGLSAILSSPGRFSASLQLSCMLAEALELGAAKLLLSSLFRNGDGNILFLADIVIAVSSVLTLDYASLCGVWLASMVVRAMLAFRKIGDARKVVSSILGRLFIAVTVSTISQIAFVVITVSLSLGKSEVAYGGTYNLRYLDAEMRRTLRPGFEMPTSFSDPGPGLHSMTPYSLYVPSAGFLWTDDLLWNVRSGSFESEATFREDYKLEQLATNISIPDRRAVMRDPVGKINPWILQKSLGHSFNDGLEQDILLNREPVVLRSVVSKRFLRVQSEPSSLEAHAGFKNASETGRFAVGMSNAHDDDCIFEVRDSASGFRLYHAEQGCYLATTFRSFPDYDALKLNDTMLHELRSEFEMSCVQLASERASTFYVVDGYRARPDEKPTELPHIINTSMTRNAMRHLKRGATIVATMWRLHAFRQAYHEIQDTPLELLDGRSNYNAADSPSGKTVFLEMLTTSLPALCFIILALYKQRTNQSTTFWTSRKGQTLAMNVGIIIIHRLGNLGSHGNCSYCAILIINAITLVGL